MPLSLAASRSAFEGKAGWSLHISSSSICSSGVVGLSRVLGTVSPCGISSISRSPLVQSPEDTSTTSGSGCGVKGLGGGLTCNGLMLGKGLGQDCQLVCISGCSAK